MLTSYFSSRSSMNFSTLTKDTTLELFTDFTVNIFIYSTFSFWGIIPEQNISIRYKRSFRYLILTKFNKMTENSKFRFPFGAIKAK